MHGYKAEKYLVIKANGKAYEIDSVTVSEARIEFNLVSWGSTDESKKDKKMKKRYTKTQIAEAISYWEKQLAEGNYKKVNECR